MMKASTVRKYENSQSKVKHVSPTQDPSKQSSDEPEKEEKEEWEEKFVYVSNPSEKIGKLVTPDLTLEKQLSLVSPLSTSLFFEPVFETKDDEQEEYTGFTIALRDNQVKSLQLKRQDSLVNLQVVLDVATNAEEEKLDGSRVVIEAFSDARVGNIVELPTNPYCNPEEIWTGIELTVLKNDQEQKYVIMSRGLVRWITDTQQAGLCAQQSTESIGLEFWDVDNAAVVREKGKGPYVQLKIDEEHAVYLKAIKASAGELQRFMTDNYLPNTTEEEVTFNSNVFSESNLQEV